MSGESEKNIQENDNGPASLESEYDEYLAIPCDFQSSNITFANGDTTGKFETDGIQMSK